MFESLRSSTYTRRLLRRRARACGDKMVSSSGALLKACTCHLKDFQPAYFDRSLPGQKRFCLARVHNKSISLPHLPSDIYGMLECIEMS